MAVWCGLLLHVCGLFGFDFPLLVVWLSVYVCDVVGLCSLCLLL